MSSSSSSLSPTSTKSLKPILRLRKSLIRPFDESDAAALAREANNPKIARWMRNTFPHPYTIEDATKWISISASATPMLDFAICRPDDDDNHNNVNNDNNNHHHNNKNTVIGGIGLKTRDDVHYRTMQIGYWLGEQHLGQGIVTEAISSFSDWAFENFKHVVRLEAEIYEGNDASAWALEKAGYSFEAKNRNAIEKMGVVMSVLCYCKFRPGYWMKHFLAWKKKKKI